MPKIIVADDEFYARKGLIQKIHMVSPDSVITGDFENGEEALCFIRQNREKAEILLTDVKMPEMDGLELARHIAEEELGTEIIIVSGYDEFEYAKKAMSFGVSNYLIKPVQLDELKEALEKITKKKEKYEEKVREKVRDQMALKALEFLSIPELAGHRKWREHFLDPVFDCHKEDNFIMAVLQIQNENGRNEKLDKEIENIIKKENGCYFYFDRYHEYTVIFFLKQQDEFQRRIIPDLLRKMNARYDLRMTAGISLEHQGTHELKKAYQEAVYAINQRLIDGWVKAYSYQKENRPSNYFTKEMEVMLQDAIVQRKADAAADIEKHYQENINLSELAEHKYFMNNSYLSRLFKNEVGQTFSKYLMEYRIRKAAALLENDLLKINDVAMLSGYNDVSHFIQYFKKFYGCTPEEFRSRRLEELKNGYV